MRWNLDNIYKAFYSDEFQKDLGELQILIKEINKYVDEYLDDLEDAAIKIQTYLKMNNEYRSIYLRLQSYAELRTSIDGQDDEAINMVDKIDTINNEIITSFTAFTKWIKDIPDIETVIGSSLYLLEHRFYLCEIISKSSYLLDEKQELLIKRMQSTGSRAWQKLYMSLTSSAEIQIVINGIKKQVTLGELKNLEGKNDPEIRKLAAKAEKDICENLSKSVNACINGITGEANTICELKGYGSVLEKVLLENRMDKQTLEIMMDVIKKNLPIFHTFFKYKGNLLGHKAAIPYIDAYATIKKGNMKVSYNECKELIISGFQKFSQELSNFAKRVFDEKWIDAEPRKGKGNYGLTIDIFPIKESRIITNFSGNYVDVAILAHEIGHAYHSYCLRQEEILNTDYPVSIAETASIFCESILNQELMDNPHTEDKLAILERSISDAAYYIVEMYSRYIFECELFLRRKEGMISVNTVNEIMIESLKQAYGDSVDIETMNPYAWVNNIGFYMVGNEYLDFPYSFGVLFAKGLYAQHLKRGKEFVVEFEQFLKMTSKMDIYNVSKSINIDVHSVDFWNDAMKMIEYDIKKFIQSVKD